MESESESESEIMKIIKNSQSWISTPDEEKRKVLEMIRKVERLKKLENKIEILNRMFEKERLHFRIQIIHK